MKKIYSLMAAMVMAVNMFALVNVSAAEAAVSTQSALENVALGKKVTVSGISAGKAAYITDGTTEVSHTGTAEAHDGYCKVSVDDSGSAWAIVDLGRGYDISMVTAQVHRNEGSTLTMSVSSDGVTWSKGWAKKGVATDWTGDSWTFTNTFYYNYAEKNVRYVKISNTSAITFGEISVYSALGYDAKKIGIGDVKASVADAEHSIYGAIDNPGDGNAWQNVWVGRNSAGETIDATFTLAENIYVDTVYITPHSENSVKNNFKVYAAGEVDETGHVAKTADNLVFEQGEENFDDKDISTMGITVGKNARYITVSRNAKAAGEENVFSIANFVAYGGTASTENVELTNVALKKPVTGSQVSDTMGLSRVNDGGKGAGNWSYCSAQWSFSGVVIDLGAWYNVRKIDLTMPLSGTTNANSSGNRQYFEVWGSAKESFDNSAICLMDTGATVRGDGETVSEDVKVTNIVRYIKVMPKTSLSSEELAGFSTYFTFQEIAVYADASKEYFMADGSLFTVAAEGGDFVAAANIGDNDSTTKFDTGSKTGFTLNLGKKYNVAAVQLVSNNTNYSYGQASSNSARKGFVLESGEANVKRYMRDFAARGSATYIFDSVSKTQQISYNKKIDGGKPSFTMAAGYRPYHPNPAAYINAWDDTAYTNINLADVNVFCLPLAEVTISDAKVEEDALLPGLYIFTANVNNGTSEDVKALPMIAIYGEEGKVLKKVLSQDFTGITVAKDGGSTETYVEFDTELDGYVDGDTVKAFLWNAETYEPYWSTTIIE